MFYLGNFIEIYTLLILYKFYNSKINKMKKKILILDISFRCFANYLLNKSSFDIMNL